MGLGYMGYTWGGLELELMSSKWERQAGAKVKVVKIASDVGGEVNSEGVGMLTTWAWMLE